MPRAAPFVMLALLGLLPAQAPAGTGRTLFTNKNLTFHLELPNGWRQLAPNEARRLAERPDTPLDLRRAEPRAHYAVGPVDQWLGGDCRSAWLMVHEIAEEAVIPEDYVGDLTRMWQAHGFGNGIDHTLEAIQKGPIGPGNHPAITALRTSQPRQGGPATKSLDAYIATGRQQVTLAFTCPAAEFDRWQPEFRAMLATAAFSRPARAETKLADRLWTPLWTGAVVGLVLLFLYKHTRGKR